MAVVTGTAAIRPMEPTRVATISPATTSLFTTSEVDVPTTLNTSTGSEAPT